MDTDYPDCSTCGHGWDVHAPPVPRGACGECMCTEFNPDSGVKTYTGDLNKVQLGGPFTKPIDLGGPR